MSSILTTVKIQFLYAILISIPFIGLRLMDSVLGIVHPTQNLNPMTGSLGLKLGLSFIPELIAVLVLISAGILTRNVASLGSEDSWQNRKNATSGSSVEEMTEV
jgi:hypothetical protein